MRAERSGHSIPVGQYDFLTLASPWKNVSNDPFSLCHVRLSHYFRFQFHAKSVTVLGPRL